MSVGQCELVAVTELLGHLGEDRERARESYRQLVQTREPLESVHGNGAIAGSDDFLRAHLGAIEPSPDIPSAQRQLPRPPLANVLAKGTLSAIARAYESGHTMPTIARELGLHPSTISRRLTRYNAQIKT